MPVLFADTSYYVAFMVNCDALHRQAMEWSRKAQRILLTDCVVLELGNALAGSKWRPLAPQLVQDLLADPLVQVIPLLPELLQAGLNLYSRRADKEWSLTDCISFVVMKQHGVTQALTADHHFEQAGFTILLK
jgi:predicted nucleic acid-binding protein